MRAWSISIDGWRLRGRTLAAILLLCGADLLVRLVPFRIWRHRLGLTPAGCGPAGSEQIARRWSVHVVRASARLPFRAKCLPQAIALSWLLRRARIAHAVVLAVRPADARGGDDALHAWVEHAGTRLIGDLPGPWRETLRLAG